MYTYFCYCFKPLVMACSPHENPSHGTLHMNFMATLFVVVVTASGS